MIRFLILPISMMVLSLAASLNADEGARELPGRGVKVAAICIGFGGERDAKLKLGLEHLETAGREGVDIACLPEECADTAAEPVPGPTTSAVAEMAQKFRLKRCANTASAAALRSMRRGSRTSGSDPPQPLRLSRPFC